jgi:hypothetical protein
LVIGIGSCVRRVEREEWRVKSEEGRGKREEGKV